MNPWARARHLVARRPWLYWLVVLALAVATGLVVADATARVDAARQAWGEDRAVLVAARDGRPGDPAAPLATPAVRPAPMVPDAALAELPAPDAVLRQEVRRGEVLVDADVVATGRPTALIPPGWRAVAIAESVPSGAAIGDRVEVVAGGLRVSSDGVVVGRVETAVLVAVPVEVAPTVAQAAATGEAALLLVP